MPGSIAVGTSGWSYEHWAGVFYPVGVPRSRWFEHYVTQFATVEINYSFYRLPRESTVESWRRTAPEGFRFAVKGSRYITHVLRLQGARDAVTSFYERFAGLEPLLGVVLWQLPPTLQRDADVLDAFLDVLPGGVRHAVEFRHESWMTEEIFRTLERHRTALVCVSSEWMPAVRRSTAGFVYARFHGLDTGYDYDYTDADLEPWAAFLREQSSQGLDGYVYFNNDAHGNAPRDARRLISMLGDAAAPWQG